MIDILSEALDIIEGKVPMSNEFEEVYIGDGVYARWDGFSVLLKTERDGGTHFIYLEPQHVERLAKLIEEAPRLAKEVRRG